MSITNSTDIKRIIRECYVQYVTIHLTTQMKWTDFFERHKLPKLIQEEIDNLNSPVCIKDIEFVGKTFSQRKLQAQVASLMNSTRHLRKKAYNYTQNLLGN